ncbi:MAG TPA: sulfite exporter TauE/SafE family protein [Solirubrobacteraceae bacterium]|nr:sulfite exporter TauE/SafE family protein [Solirubrobacteraceae bacterium]
MVVEYVAFAAWCFAVAFAGGLVGLVLGNLRLPATLLVAAGPAAGTGANLIVSAAAAGAASIAHIRAGRINWRLFAWMAPPSIVGAVAGGYLSGVLPRGILLGFIAAVLLYSGIALLRWKPPQPDTGPKDDPPRLDVPAAVASGAIIGLLGGIVGLILGSLRMPALLRFVGEVPHRAVGTNVAVGFFVGIAGALGHLPSSTPDWSAAAVGSAASIPGALAGSRLTGRLSPAQLVRAIGVVLLVAAAGTLVEIFR